MDGYFDSEGKIIELGCGVAYIEYRTGTVQHGTVKKFTPTKVKIECSSRFRNEYTVYKRPDRILRIS